MSRPSSDGSELDSMRPPNQPRSPAIVDGPVQVAAAHRAVLVEAHGERERLYLDQLEAEHVLDVPDAAAARGRDDTLRVGAGEAGQDARQGEDETDGEQQACRAHGSSFRDWERPR